MLSVQFMTKKSFLFPLLYFAIEYTVWNMCYKRISAQKNMDFTSDVAPGLFLLGLFSGE